MLGEDIPPDQWARFRIYAPLVRELRCQQWEWAHPSTWTFVARICGREPMLPNLRILYNLPVDPRGPATLMFITPKLRQLGIRLVGEQDMTPGDKLATSCLIRQTTRTAPNITHLFVSVDSYPPLPAEFLWPLRLFHKLQSVALDNCFINQSLALNFACTESLETLLASIDLSDYNNDEEDEDECNMLREGDFERLRHLELRGKGSQLNLFFADFVPPQLEMLTLVAIQPESWEELDELYACLTRIADAKLSRLDKVKIEVECSRERIERRKPLLQIIRPLLDIRTLKSVRVEVYGPPNLSDDDLAQMIAAWPELTALHIPVYGGVYYKEQTVRPSAAALVHLARSAPKLEELSLPELNISRLPDLEVMPYVGHRALRKFHASLWAPGHSIHRPEIYRAAVFIDRLFPDLDFDGLAGVERDSHAQKTKWQYASEALRAMRLGRNTGAKLKEIAQASRRPNDTIEQ